MKMGMTILAICTVVLLSPFISLIGEGKTSSSDIGDIYYVNAYTEEPSIWSKITYIGCEILSLGSSIISKDLGGPDVCEAFLPLTKEEQELWQNRYTDPRMKWFQKLFNPKGLEPGQA
jgi:hypothetical protein